MTQSSQQLEYAPSTPASRAARVRRWMLPAVLGLMIVSAVVIAPRLIGYAQTLHRQRQCLTYSAPATQVVLETNPAEAKKLLGDTRYATSGTTAYLVPSVWTNYYTPLGGGFQTSGTVFLHERVTPTDGSRVLVGLEIGLLSNINSSGVTVSFSARVVKPGSVFRRPRLNMTMTRGDGQTFGTRHFADRLTIYAGQPDPNDSSHFTIDYDLNGVRHTLDAWLVDDTEVKIESRD